MAWISQQAQAAFSTAKATPADGKRHAARKAERGTGKPHSKSQVQWAPGQPTQHSAAPSRQDLTLEASG